MTKEKEEMQKLRSPREVPELPIWLEELGRWKQMRHTRTGLKASRVTANGLPSQRKPQRWQAVEKSFLAGHKHCSRLKSSR